MVKKYNIPESDEAKMVEEPAAAYGVQQSQMHINLTYDVPGRIDAAKFRMMMDNYAMYIINGASNADSADEVRERLVLAANDAREGRTMSCDEVHENLEKRFPWLCK